MLTRSAPPATLTRDLVLVGGGHAHALVLKRWGMAPLPGARVTLIHPGATAPYTGMLPGHAAGRYTLDELEIDLVRLARFAGARLVSGMAQGIDPDAGLVHVTGRAPVRFDVLSLDIGISGAIPDAPGAQHILAAKPLDVFAARWGGFIRAVQAGHARAEVCVIGAGAAGVELALAAMHRLKNIGRAGHVRLAGRGAVWHRRRPARRATPRFGAGAGARRRARDHGRPHRAGQRRSRHPRRWNPPALRPDPVRRRGAASWLAG